VSVGMTLAASMSMRHVALLLSAAGLFALVGCGTDDNAVTDGSSELNEGRGALERVMDPPIAGPKSELIGASMNDVFTAALGTLTAGSGKKAGDGCTKIEAKDTKTKKVAVERLQCESSDVVRILNSDGTSKLEHYDLNKDGKVDRYIGEDGAVVQYQDTNFDGKIDLVIERVDKVKDFSLKGYDEDFPKSQFLYRVREDRDRDGKLEHEKLTARGSIPKAEE
jgi:hypothetical protein